MSEIASFQDWINAGGGKVPPGMQQVAYQDYVNQTQGAQTAQQNQATADLNTNYGTALNSLQGAETADVNQFNATSPLMQRKLVGQLNSRGLGTSMNTITGYNNQMDGSKSGISNSPSNGPGISVPIYGSGNAQYKNLISNQASQLGNIQAGYQGLADNLSKQKAGDTLNLDNFYSQLAQQRAYARQIQNQNTPGIGDALGLAAGVASII